LSREGTVRPSTLREEHVEVTRRSVLNAVSRLLERMKPEAISFAAVAEEAQVSVRTVYRHFPTKETLLDAHWRFLFNQITLRQTPSNQAELLALVPETLERYEQHEKLIQAYLVPDFGKDLADDIQAAIRTALRKVVQAEDHHKLGNENETLVAAAINCIFCLRGWLSMREDWNLNAQQIDQATRWALRLMLKAVEEGNFPLQLPRQRN
jgi:AcrR family transcriptional regulator